MVAAATVSRRRYLIRLHDLAHKDVQLSVFLFSHFGDLKGPHLVPIDDSALGWRSVTAGKFHDYARG